MRTSVGHRTEKDIDKEDLRLCLGSSGWEEPSQAMKMEDMLMREKLIEALPMYPTRQALADALGIDRTTLYRKLQKYNLS